MNTAYAQHGSPPHEMRGSIDNNATYRTGPPYPPPNHMPIPQQSQMPTPYGDPYNAMNATRAPMAEGVHPGEAGLAPLVPGTQPTAPDPMPRSCSYGGRHYELVVVQQPRRARMCGFGDKDRRPITPPPCVKLIVTQNDTGKEADFNDIEHGMFVLNVDLWSADGTREVNLVRHTANSPSISAGVPTSYQDNPTTQYAGTVAPQGGQQQPYNPYPNHGPPQVNPTASYQAQSYGQPPLPPPPQYHQGYSTPVNSSQSYPPQNGYAAPTQSQQMYYTTGAGIHASAAGPGPAGVNDYNQQQIAQYGARPSFSQDVGQRTPVNNPPQGMFTRNLIGSLAASAFRLTDPEDKIGIWFVLQDLSVRTEGSFRLRFSFVNVGETSSVPMPSNQEGIVTRLNQTKAPVLACCFSEVFTVYSAKRFPGVVESTPLSKCFATQGIKIPIRKDGPGKGDGGRGRAGDEYDED